MNADKAYSKLADIAGQAVAKGVNEDVAVANIAAIAHLVKGPGRISGLGAITPADDELVAALKSIFPDYSSSSPRRQEFHVLAAREVGAMLPALPQTTTEDWKALLSLKSPEDVPLSDIVLEKVMDKWVGGTVYQWTDAGGLTNDPYTQATGGRISQWTKASRKAWRVGVDAQLAEAGIPRTTQSIGEMTSWLYDDGFIVDAFAARSKTLAKQYAKTAKRKKTQKATAVIAAVAAVVAVVVTGGAALTFVTSLPGTASTAVTSTLTAIGVPATLAPALSTALVTAGTDAVAQGFKKKDVADATADVAMSYVPPSQAPNAPVTQSTGMSLPIKIGLVAGGITVTGLVIWLATKK